MLQGSITLSNRGSRKGRRGFSLLELLVSLLILSMVAGAVLKVLGDIRSRSRMIDFRLTRQRMVENCLDWLIQDVAMAAIDDEIIVERDSYEGHETASVNISTKGASKTDASRISWASVPRGEERDLVLYRREETSSKEDGAMYVPLCESLNSFSVELYDEEGQSFLDPNRPVQMLEIIAEVFMDDTNDPERVLVVRRSFCRERF